MTAQLVAHANSLRYSNIAATITAHHKHSERYLATLHGDNGVLRLHHTSLFDLKMLVQKFIGDAKDKSYQIYDLSLRMRVV